MTDSEIKILNNKLRMVALARKIFGKQAARDIWEQLGLPVAPSMKEDGTPQGD